MIFAYQLINKIFNFFVLKIYLKKYKKTFKKKILKRLGNIELILVFFNFKNLSKNEIKKLNQKIY